MADTAAIPGGTRECNSILLYQKAGSRQSGAAGEQTPEDRMATSEILISGLRTMNFD